MIHLVNSIRKKSDIPVIFFYNESLELEMIKLNELYGNIFHFHGDYFDKKHLKRACIEEAFCVLVMTNHEYSDLGLADAFSIQFVKMLEQFFKIKRIIVEM